MEQAQGLVLMWDYTLATKMEKMMGELTEMLMKVTRILLVAWMDEKMMDCLTDYVKA